MKRLFFIVLTLCLLPLTTLQAQDAITGSLLDIENRDKPQDEIFSGRPYVFIDKTEGMPDRQDPKFEPIPFKTSSDMPIITPFGEKAQASFLPHTTDYMTQVKILPNKDVVIEETIQYVQTTPERQFERYIPKVPQADFFLIKGIRDGQVVKIQTKQDESSWIVTDKQPQQNGVHTYTLHYLIKNIVTTDNSFGKLNLSLTGTHWPLPVERFSAVILFPSKTALFKNDVLFGTNNVKIDGAATIQSDENGNISFYLNRPLPAYADVKIAVDFDRNVLSKATFSDWLSDNLNHMIFVLCCLILILYTVISLIYLRLLKPSKFPVKDLNAYSLIALRYIQKGHISAHFLNSLKEFYAFQHKSKLFLKVLTRSNPIQLSRFKAVMLRVFSYINILRKYIITDAIIIGITLWEAKTYGEALAPIGITLLILLSGVLLIWIYKKGEKPHIERLIIAFEESSIQNDHIGFGLSPSSLEALFVQLYPYTLAIDEEKQWINCLKDYKLNFDHMTFIKNKETIHE